MYLQCNYEASWIPILKIIFRWHSFYIVQIKYDRRHCRCAAQCAYAKKEFIYLTLTTVISDVNVNPSSCSYCLLFLCSSLCFSFNNTFAKERSGRGLYKRAVAYRVPRSLYVKQFDALFIHLLGYVALNLRQQQGILSWSYFILGLRVGQSNVRFGI